MRYRLAAPMSTETFRQPTDFSSDSSEATAVPRQIATSDPHANDERRSSTEEPTGTNPPDDSRPLHRDHATGHRAARVHFIAPLQCGGGTTRSQDIGRLDQHR